MDYTVDLSKLDDEELSIRIGDLKEDVRLYNDVLRKRAGGLWAVAETAKQNASKALQAAQDEMARRKRLARRRLTFAIKEG